MSKLVSLLNKEPFTLVVRLPEAYLELAQAAEEGGADAIIVPLGNLKEQASELKKIVSSSKVPVGISIRDNKLSADDMSTILKLCMDFIEVGIKEASDIILKAEGIGKIVALDPDYSAYDITAFSREPINTVDAAVIAEEDLGKDLTVGDLQKYITIVLSTGLPVLVPTQKLIRVSEVPVIWDTGAKGIILNELVAGVTAQSVRSVTKEFKEAVESLKIE